MAAKADDYYFYILDDGITRYAVTPTKKDKSPADETVGQFVKRHLAAADTYDDENFSVFAGDGDDGSGAKNQPIPISALVSDYFVALELGSKKCPFLIIVQPARQQSKRALDDTASPKTPRDKKPKEKPSSPGAELDNTDEKEILTKLAGMVNFSAMKVPSSPFRYPDSLKSFANKDLAHTKGQIDMRFGAECSPMGKKLNDQVLKDLGDGRQTTGIILLGKSGVGKTTAIFDVARKFWCVLFTGTSYKENLAFSRKDPGLPDHCFAELEGHLTDVLLDRTLNEDEKARDCDHLIRNMVIARMFVMWRFSLMSNNPGDWLVFQLTDNDAHDLTMAVYEKLRRRDSHVIGGILRALNAELKDLSIFFSLDEAQYGYDMLKEISIWKSTKEEKEVRGMACPFIRMLAMFRRPIVLAGTAMSLGSAASCKSDVGKTNNITVFTDFPSLDQEDIGQNLRQLLNLEGADLTKIGLWKLEGRGRLFGGLIPMLVKVIASDPQEEETAIEKLTKAVNMHFKRCLENLTEQIETYFLKDSKFDSNDVMKTFEFLAIAALWGGSASLPANAELDLLDSGVCSISIDPDGDVFILDEELGRQAILEAMEKRYKVTTTEFDKVLALCAPAAGHAVEPILVAELRAWSLKHAVASVEDFINHLFPNHSINLPGWAKEAQFNVRGGYNKKGRTTAQCINDTEFVLKAFECDEYRNLLLSPSTVKRCDFEGVMGPGDDTTHPWFLSISSKLYSKNFNDSSGNDLRSTDPQMFFKKKDGSPNVKCCKLRKQWETVLNKKASVFERCLRLHLCIPGVIHDEKDLLRIEADDSIVAYITKCNVAKVFRPDTVEVMRNHGYI